MWASEMAQQVKARALSFRSQFLPSVLWVLNNQTQVIRLGSKRALFKAGSGVSQANLVLTQWRVILSSGLSATTS